MDIVGRCTYKGSREPSCAHRASQSVEDSRRKLHPDRESREPTGTTISTQLNSIGGQLSETPQRIDSIKAELTNVLGIGDLGNDESTDYDTLNALRLDGDDVELLQEASLFQVSSTRSSVRKTKHIIFVNDESEGGLLLSPL